MAELPYSLRIPGEVDTVIVHAGLVPGVPLEKQSFETMVTLREVVLVKDNTGASTYRSATSHDDKTEKLPWAGVWNGDFKVIFGHDARRGLQLHPNAIGLDTGACYGKRLSGLILKGATQTLVSVPAARVYSPVTQTKQQQ
jgi:hypothetical protein